MARTVFNLRQRESFLAQDLRVVSGMWHLIGTVRSLDNLSQPLAADHRKQFLQPNTRLKFAQVRDNKGEMATEADCCFSSCAAQNLAQSGDWTMTLCFTDKVEVLSCKGRPYIEDRPRTCPEVYVSAIACVSLNSSFQDAGGHRIILHGVWQVADCAACRYVAAFLGFLDRATSVQTLWPLAASESGA